MLKSTSCTLIMKIFGPKEPSLLTQKITLIIKEMSREVACCSPNPKVLFFTFWRKNRASCLFFIWNKEDVKRKSLSPALLLQNLSWHRLLLPVVDKCCMRNISLINVIFWCFKQKYFAINYNNYQRYFAVKCTVFGARCTQTSKNMTWTPYFLLCVFGWQRN